VALAKAAPTSPTRLFCESSSRGFRSSARTSLRRSAIASCTAALHLPRRSASTMTFWTSCQNWSHSRHCINHITCREFGPAPRCTRTCRKSHASTPRFTKQWILSPAASGCRAPTTRRACDDTASTGCRTSSSHGASGRLTPISRVAASSSHTSAMARASARCIMDGA
jgi:hypothetical protein